MLVATLGCGGSTSDKSNELNGAGSTFVYPLMVQWAHDYERCEEGCKVTYHASGSDGGIKFLTEKKVDFGCTDGPMTDEELEMARATGGEVLHVPLVLGAVVPVYNLANVKDPLRFSGPVLADIFLGKVKKWNDEALQNLNPGVKLPDQEIHVVHRLDGSGTTYIWTDYLSKVSPDWQKRVGTATTVKWPTGEAESLNDGVVRYVKENPGSLGYVEMSYAYRDDLAFGLVRNREGGFVKASLPSVTAAADKALAHIPDDLRYSLTDAPGKDSYPISGTTWAILYVNQPRGKGQKLVDFLSWVIGDGQERARSRSSYAKLPESLVKRSRAKLDQVQMGR